MKQLDISNKTLRELAGIGVVGAYSEEKSYLFPAQKQPSY